MAVKEGIGLTSDVVKEAIEANAPLINGTQSGYEPGADPELGAEICRLKKKDSGSKTSKIDIPTAFKQTKFASTYESRINQTPAQENKKVMFIDGDRGETLCVLKPPPDSKLQSLLDEVGVDGVLYKNAVPDFSPFAKAEVEIEHMVGGKGANGNKAKNLNFQQANSKLAEKLNKNPELANKFGMQAGNIKPSDIEKFRVKNDLTWHELNDTKTMQLVPMEINNTFGHLGGIGEINAGAYERII